MIERVRRFGRFWYDFIVGDDWVVAAGVVLALTATWGISRLSIPAWWFAPAAVGMLLPHSVLRAIRKR